MYYILTAFSKLVSLFPIKFLYSLSSAVTKTIFFFWVSKRKNVFNNYKRILEHNAKQDVPPSEIKKVMSVNFENYAKFNAEFLILNKLVKKNLIHLDFSGIEHVREGLSYGKGHVMGTLHFGNWDAAGVMISHSFQPNWAVADDLGGGYSKYVQDTRKKYGIDIVLPNKNLKDIYTSLSQNGILNVLVDRPAPASDKKAVEVEFFGKKTIVVSAAARIILKTGAKATLGYAIRKNGEFYGCATPLVKYELTGEHNKDIQIITQALFKEAEKIIAKYPEQWYMFRPFWPET